MLKYLLTGLCFTISVGSTLVAEENINEHVQIGTRAESVEARMAKRDTRAKMAEMYPDGLNDLDKTSSQAKSFQALKGAFNPKIPYVLHPASCQTASFFYSENFNCMMAELTDGSTWFVDPDEYAALSNWNPMAPVIITQNHAWRWRSPYDFRLTNQWTGQSVGINIDLGPISPVYACFYTHWIVDIDYYKNIVYLEDGSKWHMSIFDSSTISQWVPGDIVIIGVNDGWLFAYNPNMLINVAMYSDFAVGAAVFP